MTNSHGRPIELVIYGDFTCPFSALASERAARLEATGRAAIDWRAVAHDPTIPSVGSPVDADRRRELWREIEVVGQQLEVGESLSLEPPAALINPVAVNRRYAALGPRERPAARRRLFRAYWSADADMTDPAITTDLPPATKGDDLADRWQSEWSGFDRPIVPAMVLPEGRLSRGLGALARLADLLRSDDAPGPRRAHSHSGADTGDEGGDAPCWAHLVDGRGPGADSAIEN